MQESSQELAWKPGAGIQAAGYLGLSLEVWRACRPLHLLHRLGRTPVLQILQDWALCSDEG